MSFADELRSIIREELERALAKPAPSEFIDQKTCAPISSRVYLRAANAGEFPSTRRGKKVLCRREDFEIWLSANPTVTAAKPASPTASAVPKTREERLAASGFRIAGSK